MLLQKLERKKKELSYISTLLGKRILKSHLFISVLSSVIHLGQKVEASELSLKDEWKNKLQCGHTMDYYSIV